MTGIARKGWNALKARVVIISFAGTAALTSIIITVRVITLILLEVENYERTQ